MEQFGKDEEIVDSKQGPDDTLISEVQTEQRFVNLSCEDYKDENLIDDDMLKQDVFLRGIRINGGIEKTIIPTSKPSILLFPSLNWRNY